MMKELFINSIRNFASDEGEQIIRWNEIEKNYSNPNRHYHNLTHLDNLAAELSPFKNRFSNWGVIVFAIVYHDIIYNTLKSDNEEKSADLAVKRLKEISFPKNLITQCKAIILATKRHEMADEETNLFTDADLSILGSEPKKYKLYTQQIRKEYKIYPSLVYNPGRKKVLSHFLKMEKIFKTKEFSMKYESQARMNLNEELSTL
jgi:predicted metal-dependent HD superfamily phosphohydrolase